MKLPKLESLNIYMVAAVGIVIILFLASPIGQDFEIFWFGNTCAAGSIYDANTKTCSPAQTNVVCGTGTYLEFDANKGYSCKLSNFALALIVLMGGMAIYFYFNGRRGEQWFPAKDCFKWAINNGHLKTKRQNWIDAWDACEEPHQIIPKNAWLFVGEFVKPGECYTALISGTDKKGWVLDGWKGAFSKRQIDALAKQSMKLEQALLTVASEKQRVDAAAAAFRTEQEELA